MPFLAIVMYIAIHSYIQGVAIMCREYTYFWPTFNGALVAEMSPNPVFWYQFSWGACPQTPPALECWVCFAHLHHQKVHFFLKRTYPH